MALKRRVIRRQGPTGYGVTAREANQVKEFNENNRTTQGQRAVLNAGNNPDITISLNQPGRRLLGISVVPTSTSDVSDCICTFVVNNNNLLNDVAVSNLVPNFVQGMIFFPTPQKLSGQDVIKLKITKNNAGTATINVNTFYVPQGK